MILNTTTNDVQSSTWIKDVGTADFAKEVLEASLNCLVLVDFWAAWCGPCKTLTPVLEEVVQSYNGKVRLAKIDVDLHQVIAQQMQIRSLPSVYMFLAGDVVDGFVGIIAKQEIEQKIEAVLQKANGMNAQEVDTAELWQQADTSLAEHQLAVAEELFQQIVNLNGEDRRARMMLLHLGLLRGNPEREQEVRRFLEETEADSSEELMEIRVSLESLLRLDEEARVVVSASACENAEMATRQQEALELIAKRKFDAAIETLLEMIKKDAEWQEGRARNTLLRLLSAMGTFDVRVSLTRSRLSNILFA